MKSRTVLKLLAVLALVGIFGSSSIAREYLQLPTEKTGRGYSPGVITKGGRFVWLAGVATLKDEQGKSLAGDVPGQTRFIFRELGRQLAKAGGTLDDIVMMNVYLTDEHNRPQFSNARREVFTKTTRPASTITTVSGLSEPGYLIEINAIAVIGDEK